MGLYRLYAIKDTFVSNVVINGVVTTAVANNFGASPTLQVYKGTGTNPTAPQGIARSLINFDIGYLARAVQQNLIPAANVSYILKAFDYPLQSTVPTSCDLYVWPMSSSWDEGGGLDYQNYEDFGWANWMSGTSARAWVSGGGDFVSGSVFGSASMHLDVGTEDLEVDVTQIVNNWLSASFGSGALQPNGFMIKLGNTEETNGNDYYIKAFYSRNTQHAAKVPYLEARWNDVRKDNRNNFAYNQSSSLYLYNLVRGVPTDLPNVPSVTLQDNVVGISCSYAATFPSTRVTTGVYSASFYISNSASFSGNWVDIWSSGTIAYVTGNFSPLVLTGSSYDSYPTFVISATNLKRIYRSDELAHIRVNVRQKNYNTHIMPAATGTLNTDRQYIENMYFSVLDNNTGDIVIPFSTGTLPYTQLSYDGQGNYLNLSMNSFVPGFVYRMIFLVQYNVYEKAILNDDWIFKVI